MMAPPAPQQPEFVEVRCAGCGETLEVERGLIEFACPDCGTQQMLPPELMPPPRPRRALPIPGRGPAAAVPVPVPVPAPPPAPARMPCASCSALLSVPAGLGRFACPVCGVELVVEGGRLRNYLASPAAATVSVVALPPAGVTLTSAYTPQRSEVQVERYSHPVRSHQTPAQCPSQSVHGEETSSSFRKGTPTPIHNMLAQKESLSHSVQREESHIEPPNNTTVRNSRLQAGTENIGLQKVQPEPSIQISSRPQAQTYSVHVDHTQGQRPDIIRHGQQTNDVSSIMEQGKIDRLNQAMNVEQAQDEDQCKTSGWNPNSRSNKSTSRYQKRKRKGLTSSPNEGVHVRRSKRLTKQIEHPIEDEPDQKTTASPNACNSDLPDIDRIIANLCPSSSHPHQMPQANSSESDNVDASILPDFSNPGIYQPEQFPHRYSQLYPPEVRGTHQLDKSGEQLKPQSPEGIHQPMHAQQENAEGGHLLLGFYGKSSGKRNGRRPTRLIEPRREVDRPVLIPNNIDNWDVSPPCPKVASTITVLIKQKYPGSTYLPASQQSDVPPNGEAVHHWHHYTPETKAAILKEFLQRYKWAPGKEAECLKLFERRALKQFAGILCEEKRRVRAQLASVRKTKETVGKDKFNRQTGLDEEDAREEPEDQQTGEKSEDENPLQWKPFPPAWMYPKWWERLCEHWAKDEVLMMSLQSRKNRFTAGRAHHTTGSRSIAMHRQLMVMENGGEQVSELEVFNKTHKLKGGTGEFVSERAKRTAEGFKKRMEEAGDKQIHPHLAWVQEVGGRNRGRYYGLTGIIDKAKIDELAKSIPGSLDKRGQQQKFSQDQVQQMINQALQGLNETWEKKFKSLEQTVCGGPSLGVDPEHAAESSAAGGGAQEDRSLHQDMSDSEQEGRRRSAGHEDDDGSEEVVSTSV